MDGVLLLTVAGLCGLALIGFLIFWSIQQDDRLDALEAKVNQTEEKE